MKTIIIGHRFYLVTGPCAPRYHLRDGQRVAWYFSWDLDEPLSPGDVNDKKGEFYPYFVSIHYGLLWLFGFENT